MLSSIIFAVIAAILAFFMEAMMQTGKSIKKLLNTKKIAKKLAPSSYTKAIVFGLITGAIWYFAPIAHWLAVLSYVMLLGLLIWLCLYFAKVGSRWWDELPIFSLLALMIFWAGSRATKLTAALAGNAFIASVLKVLPCIALIVAIGVFLLYLLSNNRMRCVAKKRTEEVHKQKVKAYEKQIKSYEQWFRIVAWVLAIVLLFTVGFGVNWSALKKTEELEPANPVITEEEGSVEEPDWYGFYNLNLLGDDDPSNDGHFGWDPYSTNVVGKDFDEDLRTRMEIDPALGAAVFAWFDANVGTSYMGSFYDSNASDGDWMTAINNAKERFMADEVYYKGNLNAFFRYLDSFVEEVRVEERSGITDQMYMNPFTDSGVPQVIVCESPDHSGHFLVYKVVIKGTGVHEIAFRIDCGYQPCNVAKVMNVTPQSAAVITKKSSNTNTVKSTAGGTTAGGTTSGGKTSGGKTVGGKVTSGGRYGGSGGSGGSGGGGSYYPTTNPKDVTKGTTEDKNRDPVSAGGNTNNGIGSTKSAAELSTNSSYKSSVSAGGNSYDAAIKQNKDANSTTRTGSSSSSGSGGAGSSNIPSTTVNNVDNVDSNASTGNSYGSIDQPATVSSGKDKAVYNGSVVDTSKNTEQGAWSGPAY